MKNDRTIFAVLSLLVALCVPACGSGINNVKNMPVTKRAVVEFPKDNTTRRCLEYASAAMPHFDIEGSGSFSFREFEASSTTKFDHSAEKLLDVTEVVQLVHGLAFRICEAAGNGDLNKDSDAAQKLLTGLFEAVQKMLVMREPTVLKSLIDLRGQYVKDLAAIGECEKAKEALLAPAKAATAVCTGLSLEGLKKDACKDGLLTADKCTVAKGRKLEETAPICTYLAKACETDQVLKERIKKVDEKLIDLLGLK